MINIILALALTIATIARAQTPGTNGTVLRDLAGSRFYGAAANTSFLFIDPVYTGVISTQYSIFTCENEMKWDTIEPEPNVFNFTAADEIVNFAGSINATMRGHNFMWGEQLPAWVNDTLTPDELDAALKNHITKFMEHFRGKLFAVDVCNEMISPDAPNETFADNLWTQKFGDDAVPKAFTYAREADPQPKLFINDFGIESINPKSTTLHTLLQSLLARGVPIDGVGFECHFTLGQVPSKSDLKQNLQRFVDLGLDVAITELDVNMGGEPNATALEQQARDFWTVASACFEVEGCVSFTNWGVSDDHSWLGPLGNGLPFDKEKDPKPAFFALADAFQGKNLTSDSASVGGSGDAVIENKS